MPNKSPETQQKWQQLQQQYATRLPEKIAALERDWQTINHHPSDMQCYENLLRGLHTLAGSAGSYGFPAITALCREIETSLQSTQPPLDSALKSEIDTKLAALTQLAKSRPDNK